MPIPDELPGAEPANAGIGKVGGALGHRLGPLPVWGWAIVAVGGFLAWRMLGSAGIGGGGGQAAGAGTPSAGGSGAAPGAPAMAIGGPGSTSGTPGATPGTPGAAPATAGPAIAGPYVPLPASGITVPQAVPPSTLPDQPVPVPAAVGAPPNSRSGLSAPTPLQLQTLTFPGYYPGTTTLVPAGGPPTAQESPALPPSAAYVNPNGSYNFPNPTDFNVHAPAAPGDAFVNPNGSYNFPNPSPTVAPATP